jgi:hypothetical protein
MTTQQLGELFGGVILTLVLFWIGFSKGKKDTRKSHEEEQE